MIKSIESLKLEIISRVMSLEDRERLERLASSLQRPGQPEADIFAQGPIEIISGVTLDDLYTEQGRKSLTFAELPAVEKNWEHSLDDLLRAI